MLFYKKKIRRGIEALGHALKKRAEST